MSLTEKELRKLYSEYEKKYYELEQNYFVTGSPSTYKTMNKYKDLMAIISLAEDSLKEQCHRCEMHYRNAESAVKRWKDYKALNMTDMLDFDNVIKELEGLKY